MTLPIPPSVSHIKALHDPERGFMAFLHGFLFSLLRGGRTLQPLTAEEHEAAWAATKEVARDRRRGVMIDVPDYLPL